MYTYKGWAKAPQTHTTSRVVDCTASTTPVRRPSTRVLSLGCALVACTCSSIELQVVGRDRAAARSRRISSSAARDGACHLQVTSRVDEAACFLRRPGALLMGHGGLVTGTILGQEEEIRQHHHCGRDDECHEYPSRRINLSQPRKDDKDGPKHQQVADSLKTHAVYVRCLRRSRHRWHACAQGTLWNTDQHLRAAPGPG